MKQIYMKFSMLLLCLVVGLSSWAEDVTGTISFGTNNVKISSKSVTGDDSLGNSWSITTEGTDSFTPQPSYCQVGKAAGPAEKITFEMTLPAGKTVTAFSVILGGFSGTKGTVELKVDNTAVGTGSLDATSNVTVTNTSNAKGKTLTVIITDIQKGVKCYSISYTYSDSSTDTDTDSGSDDDGDFTATFDNSELPKGWSGNEQTYDTENSNHCHTSAPGLILKNNGYVTTSAYDKITSLSFWGSTSNGGDGKSISILYSSDNGTNWHSLSDVVLNKGAMAEKEVDVTSISSLDGVILRFTADFQTAYIDDINIKYSSASSEQPVVQSDGEYVYNENAKTIESGDYILVVSEWNETTSSLSYKAITSTLEDGYLNAVDVEIDDSDESSFIRTISNLNGAAVWTVTTGKTVGYYGEVPTITFKTGENYIATNEGSLTLSATPETFVNYEMIYTSDMYSWFGFADGLMLSQNGENVAQIMFFKKADTVEHTLNFVAYESTGMDDLYFATFSSNKTTFFPNEDGVSVYAVNVDASGSLRLDVFEEKPLSVKYINEETMEEAEKEINGYFVPANTGVLVQSNYNYTSYYNVYNKTIPALAEGVTMLKPASEKMTGDYKFYKLAYDDYTNKTGLGFYYGAENGGAFTCKAGTAYLAVPSGQAVKSFTLSGAATDIKNVETATKSVIYNLNGQRLNKMQKGINIVDGKKYLVK